MLCYFTGVYQGRSVPLEVGVCDQQVFLILLAAAVTCQPRDHVGVKVRRRFCEILAPNRNKGISTWVGGWSTATSSSQRYHTCNEWISASPGIVTAGTKQLNFGRWLSFWIWIFNFQLVFGVYQCQFCFKILSHLALSVLALCFGSLFWNLGTNAHERRYHNP